MARLFSIDSGGGAGRCDAARKFEPDQKHSYRTDNSVDINGLLLQNTPFYSRSSKSTPVCRNASMSGLLLDGGVG
jgi:hypothetical protein